MLPPPEEDNYLVNIYVPHPLLFDGPALVTHAKTEFDYYLRNFARMQRVTNVLINVDPQMDIFGRHIAQVVAAVRSLS